MAGEITKSTNATNADASPPITRAARLSKGRLFMGTDTHQFAAATELEANDTKIFDIDIPSNAVIVSLETFHDDMDTHACSPTLAVDLGVVAKEKHSSVTSGTATEYAAGGLVDVDLFVDGVTTFQAAVTNWTTLVPDSGTLGAEDSQKMVWELLGYDEDPKTTYRLALTSAGASAGLSAAADCSLRVTYLLD